MTGLLQRGFALIAACIYHTSDKNKTYQDVMSTANSFLDWVRG